MIAGLILTGGKNSRMRGAIKLFLDYRGRPFLDYIKDAMSSLPKVYLSVNRTADYEGTGLPLIVDEFEAIGPIGGICSALRRVPEEAVLVSASDTPFLSKRAVEALAEAYRRSGKLTLAVSGGRVQPLLGVYPKGVLPVLERMIERGGYRLRDILDEVEHEPVELPGSDPSAENVNTPAEYRRMCKGPFFFAISGYKHTGKTTLITRLIPELTRVGCKVAVIKHDGHDFQADVPGTDSYKHKEAGAYATAVFSENRMLVHKEACGIDERQVAALFPEADIILLEGLKDKDYPRYTCSHPNEPVIPAEVLAEQILRERDKFLDQSCGAAGREKS